jgi:hypothetical protein
MTMNHITSLTPTRFGRTPLLAAFLAFGAAAACAQGSAEAASTPQPSADVQSLHRWVVKTGDHAGGPFMVVDKRQARVWVYNRQGRLEGHSPVLLGAAKGDDSVPGIGERPMSEIRPHERTTPAGRFHVEPGVNGKGEDIFWVDYDVAVSMHRVRAHNVKEQRLERLATPTAEDNRISYGCINVPVAFYDSRVHPLFAAGKGWVYVLPETRPVETLFNTVGARGTDPLKPVKRAG